VAELEVATAEQAIAAREAEHLAAEQDRAARAIALRVLLGEDDDGDARLVAADDLADDVAAPATADARTRALAFAPQLRALEHQGRAAAIELAVATADTRPRLDLIVRGGPSGHADDAGAAWAQLGRFDGYQASAAVAFAFPVGNRRARGERDAARADQRRVELDGAALRGAITAATVRAVDAVALSERRITAAAAAVTLAHRTAELERDRWRAGAGTN
jgi:outer membrane protein TolC